MAVLAGAVGDFGAQRLAECADLARFVAEHFGSAAPPSPEEIDLGPRVGVLLGRTGSPLVGAGAVYAPDALRDQTYWLDWWQFRAGVERPQQLIADVDPRSITFHDYTLLQWYAVPAATGRPHVTGPYVDYLCTDQLTLTFTIPVRVAGDFVAVAGVDVLVRDLEAHLDGTLAAYPELALVNDVGRVVASGDPGVLPGDLIARDWTPQAPGWRVRRCARLPFHVALAIP